MSQFMTVCFVNMFLNSLENSYASINDLFMADFYCKCITFMVVRI